MLFSPAAASRAPSETTARAPAKKYPATPARIPRYCPTTMGFSSISRRIAPTLQQAMCVGRADLRLGLLFALLRPSLREPLPEAGPGGPPYQGARCILLTGVF